VTYRVGVLASGAGTNLQALLDRVHGRDGVEIVAVGSDKPGAEALGRARRAGIEAAVFERAAHGDRAARDAAMATWLEARGVDLVVLAGYMALVDATFLARFPDRVINVHPALLPAFPGLDAIGQAIAYGVKVTGVTVHLVDEGVDSGAIVAQAALDVPPGANASGLHDLLRPLEHDLLCGAVAAFARGAVRRDPAQPRRIVVE
jgi:phosphoribosylglycinamide formyltransferase 1